MPVFKRNVLYFLYRKAEARDTGISWPPPILEFYINRKSDFGKVYY